jgi:hypothetical protein
MYSLFFLALALLSVLASSEPRWGAVSILAWMLLMVSLLVMGVSIYHFSKFKQNSSTVIWFAIFLVQIMVFGGLLIRKRVALILEGARV